MGISRSGGALPRLLRRLGLSTLVPFFLVTSSTAGAASSSSNSCMRYQTATDPPLKLHQYVSIGNLQFSLTKMCFKRQKMTG